MHVSTEALHDLVSAFRTLHMIIEEIEQGYRFNDSDAEEILQLFKLSVEKIEEVYRKNNFVP